MFNHRKTSQLSQDVICGLTGLSILTASFLSVTPSSALADTSVSASSTQPAAKRFDSDVETWFWTTPTATDVIKWESGAN